MTLYGGLETGGTTWCAIVGTGPDDVRDSIEFPIGEPGPTIERAIAFFAPHDLTAVGIGSFGPVDRNLGSPTWGYITSTPKPRWHSVDLAGPIGHALGVPIGFDTDVNAAALGEHRWGAAQDVDTFCYITVGTGIGGGVMVAGATLGGAMHPEIGHQGVLRDPAFDDFTGSCPYHRDCWEGLASAPSLTARWGCAPHELADDHVGWEIEAQHLAQGLANLVYILSPQRIVLGGGVMRRTGLHERVRARLVDIVNGYVPIPTGGPELDAFVCPPALGARSGSVGALALGEAAYTRATS
ncbi:MAG: ROK family protein [Mycobacteriales bacterium]